MKNFWERYASFLIIYFFLILSSEKILCHQVKRWIVKTELCILYNIVSIPSFDNLALETVSSCLGQTQNILFI